MKDDLYGPKLSPPPPTSPLVRGAAIALVTVALVGCNPGTTIGTDSSTPGLLDSAPGVDAGRDAASSPGIADAGVAPDMGHLNPGLPPLDAGVDADTP